MLFSKKNSQKREHLHGDLKHAYHNSNNLETCMKTNTNVNKLTVKFIKCNIKYKLNVIWRVLFGFSVRTSAAKSEEGNA